MKYIKKIILKLISKIAKLKRNGYKAQALITVWLNKEAYQIGKACRMHVPVKMNGSGRIVINPSVCFGYHLAPKTGGGLILIQPRTLSSEITIGRGTTLGNNLSIISCSNISIGEDCQIGEQVTIYDSDFHEISPETRNRSSGESLPVKIGNNVWIGSRVLILKGVTIGDHSVIAAGSVVTKSIPTRTLAGGGPAKAIRSI